MDLSHIKMIKDIYEDYGPIRRGPYVLLFNKNRISREEALRIARSGEFSPYALLLPETQMNGLFRDIPANK